MGEIIPLPFRLAWASNPDGNRSRGRTNVWTLQGSLSGGVGSSSCTIPTSRQSLARSQTKHVQRTVVPYSGRRANDFALVLFVVYDCPHAETHHRQRRYLLRCLHISLSERVDVLRVIDCRLEFTPRDLKHSAIDVSAQVKS